MVCPNCQKNISGNKKSCNHCGQDLTLYKKVLMASNMYYNNGLARAMSGTYRAITALKKSLELIKPTQMQEIYWD